MTFKVKGVDEANKKLAMISAATPEIMSAAMMIEAEKILTASKKVCPADKGNLRGTGYVYRGISSPVSISVGIRYPANYAAAVHEGVKIRDLPPDAKKAAMARMNETNWIKSQVGGPKFLENPARALAPSVPVGVALYVRKRWEAIL